MVRARSASPVLAVAVAAAPLRPVAVASEVPAPPRFAELVSELSPFVLRVLPRLGVRPSDVEDVSQEVLLAVYRGLPRFEGRSSPRTWVYGICLRVARNHRDRAYMRCEQAYAEPPMPDVPAAAERGLDEQRLVARLDAALSELSAEQRDTFVLHALADLDVTEIAAVQGVSKFTVYTRLYAAKRRLRAWFAARGCDEGDVP